MTTRSYDEHIEKQKARILRGIERVRQVRINTDCLASDHKPYRVDIDLG